ncbi:hypothetical protein [Haloferula sp. BvORR071]|uniref:hypothetical protein n=1 Tax=Haloferula sp. BvORR071 TaxID=1396141 RepID=UPI000550BF3C|nr:hypothetical protein [Haloferula sp. BvORR071]
MKSTVLAGALAATSLVSTLHAEVFILGASWRERSLIAPEGTIQRNTRSNVATRGYFVMERGAPPALKGAFIQYSNNKQDGKTYTITTGFTNFTADVVSDEPGTSSRIFGHAFTPVANVPVTNPTMSFSGSTFGGTKPNRVSFDRQVFQAGTSTTTAGPNIVTPGTMFRSILAGSGTNVATDTQTLAQAISELTLRLDNQGYKRAATAPIIVTDPVATLARDGFDATKTLSVTLNPDVYPTPTYQWLKGAAAPFTVVGTGATYLLPGGTAGDGTYHVVVTTAAGSDTSTNSVVTTTPAAMVFSPALPASVSVKANAFAPLTATVNANAFPQVTGYQWTKSATANGIYANVPTANGGNLQTLQVTGDINNPAGAGFYKVIVSNGTLPNLTNATPVQVIAIP